MTGNYMCASDLKCPGHLQLVYHADALSLCDRFVSILGIIQHISVHLSDQFCYFEVGCSYWFDDCDQMLNSRFLGEAIF